MNDIKSLKKATFFIPQPSLSLVTRSAPDASMACWTCHERLSIPDTCHQMDTTIYERTNDWLFVLETGPVQLLDQLGCKCGRQLVADPNRKVALGIGVRDVAQLTASTRARGQWHHSKACGNGKTASLFSPFSYSTALCLVHAMQKKDTHMHMSM